MNARFGNAGIALGPILFIIAILAILAAAIAAGSGSFNPSSANETTKTQAAAILQIGDNLRVGMDRLTMEVGVGYNGWTTSPANTSNNVDLFSPTGGGIAAPSVTMAGNPTTDTWFYPQAAIPNIGTYSANTANTLQLAVLNVSKSVCQEINNRAVGNANVPTGYDLGNFAMTAATGNIAATSNAAWPSNAGAAVVNLAGRPIGCVNNTNAGSTGYYFYEVLYVQ